MAAQFMALLPQLASSIPLEQKANLRTKRSPATNGLCCCSSCGRRNMLTSIAMLLPTAGSSSSQASSANSADYEQFVETVHPARPGWYQELFAQTMNSSMALHENQVAGYKTQLFRQLKDTGLTEKRTVVDLGIGTGPNLKYYASNGIDNVIGIDPNENMEKFARNAASKAGLSSSRFRFIHGVGEKLPLPSSSVDFVVSTLVLCSVTNVDSTLQEVLRILKPGGSFLFIEHVAAQEGSTLRFWQQLLDPIQQFVADGCHLTRDTLTYVESAKFASVKSQNVMFRNADLISPHIIGTAQA